MNADRTGWKRNGLVSLDEAVDIDIKFWQVGMRGYSYALFHITAQRPGSHDDEIFRDILSLDQSPRSH